MYVLICTYIHTCTQQGARYPSCMTRGNLRSKDGTVYTMPEDRLGGVRRQRKELRAQYIVAAWWGDVLYPWENVVTGEDGMWLKVGDNVTDNVRLWLATGTLSLPLPLADVLGDPCPGRGKVLILQYLDHRGQERVCGWEDETKRFKFLKTIQTTHSIRRLANIVSGKNPVSAALEDTAPLVTALRREVDKQQRLLERINKRSSTLVGQGKKLVNEREKEKRDRVRACCFCRKRALYNYGGTPCWHMFLSLSLSLSLSLFLFLSLSLSLSIFWVINAWQHVHDLRKYIQTYNINAYIHTNMHTYIHTFKHTYLLTENYACAHACPHADMRNEKQPYRHKYIHACIHHYLPAYTCHTFSRCWVSSAWT